MDGSKIDLTQTIGAFHSRTIEKRIATAKRTKVRRLVRIASIVPWQLAAHYPNKRSSTRDPSLRLKNGYARDDAAFIELTRRGTAIKTP